MSRLIHQLTLGLLALAALAGCTTWTVKPPQSSYPAHPDPMQSAIREASGRDREEASRRSSHSSSQPVLGGLTPLN